MHDDLEDGVEADVQELVVRYELDLGTPLRCGHQPGLEGIPDGLSGYVRTLRAHPFCRDVAMLINVVQLVKYVQKIRSKVCFKVVWLLPIEATGDLRNRKASK